MLKTDLPVPSYRLSVYDYAVIVIAGVSAATLAISQLAQLLRNNAIDTASPGTRTAYGSRSRDAAPSSCSRSVMVEVENTILREQILQQRLLWPDALELLHVPSMSSSSGNGSLQCARPLLHYRKEILMAVLALAIFLSCGLVFHTGSGSISDRLNLAVSVSIRSSTSCIVSSDLLLRPRVTFSPSLGLGFAHSLPTALHFVHRSTISLHITLSR